jgi:hypothetical protein
MCGLYDLVTTAGLLLLLLQDAALIVNIRAMLLALLQQRLPEVL